MIKGCARILAAGAAVLLVPAPATAEDEPQAAGAETEAESEDNSIIVTGRAERPQRRDVNRQARDISVTSDIYDRPLARIEDRLCPGVIGLRQDAAELMIDRIRWNAERLDMWQSKDDGTCTPNLIVAIVEDGKQAIAEIAQNQPWLFATLTPAERRALLEESGPVRVWTTAQTRTRDGMPIPRRESLDAPPTVSMWMAHSKIYLTIREDITQVVVLFDREAVRGKTVIQLADYATMRSFARTKPVEGGVAMDTILTLFDSGDAAPGGLTTFDQAYLRSVYDWIPNLPAATKLLGVNRQLSKVAEEDPARE